MKRAKKTKCPLLVTAVVSYGRRRIGKLPPMELAKDAPKLVLGAVIKALGRNYRVIGSGYELGAPVVHIRPTESDRMIATRHALRRLERVA